MSNLEKKKHDLLFICAKKIGFGVLSLVLEEALEAVAAIMRYSKRPMQQ